MSAATHLAKKDKSTPKTADDLAVAALEAAKQDKAAKAKVEKKSNLELFKEELKRIQLDREERHKKRLSDVPKSEEDPLKETVEGDIVKSAEKHDLNLDYDNYQNQQSAMMGNNKYMHPVSDTDPNTTNIFISNLSPKVIFI